VENLRTKKCSVSTERKHCLKASVSWLLVYLKRSSFKSRSQCCDAVWYCGGIPTFRRTLPPPKRRCPTATRHGVTTLSPSWKPQISQKFT